jgi:hypothetical protein
MAAWSRSSSATLSWPCGALRLPRRTTPNGPSGPPSTWSTPCAAWGREWRSGRGSSPASQWARAWAALSAGRLGEAREQAELAARTTSYFVPISLPIGARAALWAGDTDAARDLVTRIETAVIRGQAFALDVVTLRAGVAALEGRRSDAVAGYREALRGWRALGLTFDEALAGLDLAILLNPTEREMTESPAVIDAARATFTQLGARPFAARLETAGIAS